MTMRIDMEGSSACLTLDRNELRLLRFALERASFIDTPADEQPKIASFCSSTLDLLPRRERATL
jgi:hypothetical protein